MYRNFMNLRLGHIEFNLLVYSSYWVNMCFILVISMIQVYVNR